MNMGSQVCVVDFHNLPCIVCGSTQCTAVSSDLLEITSNPCSARVVLLHQKYCALHLN